MNLKTKITQLHYDRNARGIPVTLLEYCSYVYGAGSAFKNWLYDKKILRPKKVGAFVISVGNMTTGGVGKTPVVLEIARYYIKKGEKVAIISRGYGGKLPNNKVNVISDGQYVHYTAAMAGDEPFWLAQKAQGACVLTCKNRYLAAKYATEKFGVNKIILDDGFQHRKLYRDIDIVLMDSKMGLGNEKLLPAGPLREGAEALDRIDKLVIVSKNTDHTKAEKFANIMQKRLSIETLVCYTEPDYIYNIKTGEHLEPGGTATAICAIGQPQQFFDFLSDFYLKKTISFDDHHQYSPIDLIDIEGNIITTEKDAVKLLRFDKDNIYALKLKTTIDVERLLNVKRR